MKLNPLIDFIESKVPYTYFSNRFPKESPDNCAYVKLTGGFPTRESGVKQPSFQIVVRSGSSQVDWNKSEEIANKIYEELTNLQEVSIGQYSITIIRCMNSNPLYLGSDENDRPLYSINFQMVVRP
jgi:hypothetical protein